MPSVAITGAARGLGYGFAKHYSEKGWDVFALVRRNKAVTEAQVQKDGLKNVTVIEADIKDAPALKKAAEQVSKATGGTLDILINNAAFLGETTRWPSIHELTTEQILTEFREANEANVIGVIHTTNAFLPLIRAGKTKKVITLGTGHADVDLVNKYELTGVTPYAISKIGTEMVVAKYNAALGKSEGIVFLCISPGFVDNHPPNTNDEYEMKNIGKMVTAFAAYSKDNGVDFKGPLTVEQSITAMISVIDQATVETMGGKFLSHHGNKIWL